MATSLTRLEKQLPRQKLLKYHQADINIKKIITQPSSCNFPACRIQKFDLLLLASSSRPPPPPSLNFCCYCADSPCNHLPPPQYPPLVPDGLSLSLSRLFTKKATVGFGAPPQRCHLAAAAATKNEKSAVMDRLRWLTAAIR